ncbi:MAG TPA: hypothetical protein VIY86_07450, partial [Pirellulaceae bacterium]
GASQAEITGDGRLEFLFDMNVREAVTLNMVGGSVDLDGGQSFIQNEHDILAPMTINATTFDSFGTSTGGGGSDTLFVDSLSAGAVGSLTVNIGEPTNAWTVNQAGLLVLQNNNSTQVLLAGSDVNVHGTLNVTGSVSTTARIDLGPTGVVNLSGPSDQLLLAGGSFVTNEPNTIQGATIQGPGRLTVQDQKSLFGFGTINTSVNNLGFSALRADNGTLTINGPILNAPDLGTNDVDGVLNIPAAWNSGVTLGVILRGGILQGGTITNEVTIQGSGLVSSRVINNERLLATGGTGTLLVQTAGNDNDWDGTAGDGILQASPGDTLELRDNTTFAFTGVV